MYSFEALTPAATAAALVLAIGFFPSKAQAECRTEDPVTMDMVVCSDAESLNDVVITCEGDRLIVTIDAYRTYLSANAAVTLVAGNLMLTAYVDTYGDLRLEENQARLLLTESPSYFRFLDSNGSIHEFNVALNGYGILPCL
jgi:hypothetical protein